MSDTGRFGYITAAGFGGSKSLAKVVLFEGCYSLRNTTWQSHGLEGHSDQQIMGCYNVMLSVYLRDPYAPIPEPFQLARASADQHAHIVRTSP